VLYQERPAFYAVCTKLEIRRWTDLAGLCLKAPPPERCIGPAIPSKNLLLGLSHGLQPRIVFVLFLKEPLKNPLN
jgi:hypothetical protein